MTNGGYQCAPQWFRDEYESFNHGSGYKEIFIDRETDPPELVFFPKKGENWVEKLFRVNIWERNIETLQKNDIDLPFDLYRSELYGGAESMIGAPVPVLRVEYNPGVEVRKKKDRDTYETYAERFRKLAKDRAIAVDFADHHLPRKNIAVTPEKGQVVMDFGELPQQYDIDQFIDTGRLRIQ